jgi:hypothetical protein
MVAPNELKIIVFAACWLVACSRDVATGVRGSGRDPIAGPKNSGAAESGGAASFDNSMIARTPALGTPDDAFAVHVENDRKMTIDVTTLACAGDCADVEAVASGGNPPYTYAWDDGTLGAKRHVCLNASHKLTVRATDTANSTPEFAHMAQTVSADVTATVLNCTDSGVPPPPVGGTSALCISNPSFEGIPGVELFDADFHADAWGICSPSPDIWDEKQSWSGTPGGPPATDGKTYLELFCVGGGTCLVREAVGEQLCAPLVAGKTYSFKIDLAFRPAGSVAGATPGGLQVYAGTAMCGEDQLLWTSPTAGNDWQTYCATFTAQSDLNYIAFKPAVGYPTTIGVFIDHIVPVDSCPIL